MKSLFKVGKVVYTQSVANEINKGSLSYHQLLTAIQSHQSGDYGQICDDDRATNDNGVKNGGQIMSVYNINNVTVWVITEGDRSVTTVLLPSDY